MRGLLALVVLLASLASRPAAAQVGTTTDIITGTVTGADSQPLAGATVQATSVETRVSRQRVTDVHGRFTIVFPDGGGKYELTARFVGMAPSQISIAREADEDRIVARIHMGLLSVALEPVTVTARSNTRSDRSGPGSSDRSFNPDQLTRLPIDASDPAAIATLQPGVLGTGGDSSSITASFSVAGQRPTANNVTLDGMAFGSGSVPQDAVRSIRVVTNTYDVARGQFSGGLIASTTRSGTNIPQGSFSYSLRDRALAWGGVTTSAFGQGSTQNQFSGGIGGPIVSNKLFVFGALQGRWRGDALPSLTTADPGTLQRLGVSPDSAARFVALAAATGVPTSLPGLSPDRSTTTTLALLRLDWQASDAQTLTLRFDGSWDSQEPTRVGTLAVPATGGTRSTRGDGIFASLTSYFGGNFINELRGYFGRDHREARGYFALPAARVEVASDLPDSGQAVATLTFGGNPGLPQRVDNQGVEVAEEFSWLPGRTAHRLKLGLDMIGTRVEENQASNQLGTFVFPSLAALAADSPSTFTRTLTPPARAGTAWNSSLYAGDAWRPAAGLSLSYGVRLEAGRFAGAPSYNRAADSLFGIRTDRIPDEVHASPRLGFTWQLGGVGRTDVLHSTYLRGGVGDFRSPTPTSLYAAALSARGTSDAQTELVCIGAAVPRPDWSRYTQDPGTIPSQCADTAGAATVTPLPSVTAFDPGYRAPAARRASLALVQRFAGNYWVTLDGSYARGVHQYGFRDVNLLTVPRFTLPDEGGRTVYVPADSIVAATGALSSTASRIHSEFGQVLLIGSDLQSETKQLTISFTGATSRGGAFRLAYTLMRARDQSSFSCCSAAQGFGSPTTAGNPDAREWATSNFERRHSFVGTASYPVTRALEITAVGRLVSGAPFTPLVGSDINGDGARNDRAFLFDPATTGDSGVASGMRALLAGAPSAVRSCLMKQLGRIAARNSCTGPWQPAFDLQANWRPSWFGLDRRLTLSILTVNLLGGLDQWLHGATNLHGWGYGAWPDPVLLYVTGFDPATNRFRYTVNGRFGSVASTSGGITVPFQLGLQGRYALGPARVRQRARAAAPTPAVEAPTLPANLVAAILQLRDSLACTPEQVTQLAAISDSLDARDRILADSMQAVVQQAGDRTDPAIVLARLGPVVAAARDNVRQALARARAVLTPEQWSKVPEALK